MQRLDMSKGSCFPWRQVGAQEGTAIQGGLCAGGLAAFCTPSYRPAPAQETMLIPFTFLLLGERIYRVCIFHITEIRCRGRVCIWIDSGFMWLGL